jgi:hypothetical protein
MASRHAVYLRMREFSGVARVSTRIGELYLQQVPGIPFAANMARISASPAVAKSLVSDHAPQIE